MVPPTTSRKQQHSARSRGSAAPEKQSSGSPRKPVKRAADTAGQVIESLGEGAQPSVPEIPPKSFDRDRERTVSVKEAAFRLKKSHDTIYRWLRAGRLQGWQLGGSGCSILVREDSVTKALLRSLGREGAAFRKHPEMGSVAVELGWPAGRAAM